ncbi:hypothetical protein SmJEL517_g03213 [Synchytrium microbalum]|uniref:Interferon-related developmental regulator N-terminal domain-containing protein n=1 Tax=Synchytrium microbalum TaxID=1806994 RepID=A0A507C2Y1_9FUNG|nr:uncharacterized protein SmJEL517_g03213 [Synchytrium microbalum]TPX34052.1 hypothetical protein SmJEL517_g03213 [Synchytrium microbalum]
MSEKGRRQRRAREYDEDDSRSEGSEESAASHSSTSPRGREFADEALEDKLGMAVDALSEKRATTREGALHTICTVLTLKYVPDLLEERIQTLSDAVKKSISKSGVEGDGAAKALALASLTLGHGHLSNMFQIIKELARDPAFPPSNKSAVIDALAVLVLMEEQDPGQKLEWLTFAEGIFSERKQDEGVAKSSVNLWGVIATEIDVRYLHDSFDQYIAAHERLLSHESTEVRISAGENIGIIFEMMDDTDSTYDNKDGLIEKLGDLAADASRHNKGKKDAAKSQRMAFKELLATIEDSASPSHRLTIRKMEYTLTSWASWKRLNLIKYFLNEGLSVHLEQNEHVQSCLSLDVVAEAPERPTGQNKRVQQLIQQRVDKLRTKSLSTERDKRSSSRHLEED